MDRYAIFVDAGYFYAAGAHAVHSKSVPRRNVTLQSPDVAVKSLCERAAALSGISALLRVYWYDAMQGPRLSLDQMTVASLAGVKLRLGSLNSQGEQKGVDSLLVTDLIELARNRALSDAVVISGDEDLRIAVQVAQTFGVRVHLLAVGDPTTNMSTSLRMEADSVQSLDIAWITKHFAFRSDTTSVTPAAQSAATHSKSSANSAATARSPAAAKPSVTARPTLGLEEIAIAVCKELLEGTQPREVETLCRYFESNKTIPPEFDRKLIAKSGALAGRFLTAEEKRSVRGLFVGFVRRAAKGDSQA